MGENMFEFIEFTCECGRHHIVIVREGEEDSLDYHCDCGIFYKKVSRIEEKAYSLGRVFKFYGAELAYWKENFNGIQETSSHRRNRM